MIHPDFQASFYKWASSKLLFSTCSLLSLDLTLTPRKWNAFTRDLEIWRCWHQNPMYKGRAVENHQNQYQPKHKNWDRFVFLISLELCTLTGSSIFWAKKGLHIKWKHILNTAPPCYVDPISHTSFYFISAEIVAMECLFDHELCWTLLLGIPFPCHEILLL